jgi:hypothetical protein
VPQLWILKEAITCHLGKKTRLDRLSPGKTQKPKGTLSRAALPCDARTKTQEWIRVNEFYAKNVFFIKKSLIPL